MGNFIKNGSGDIIAKPKGFDYDLIAGKVYTLGWDDWMGRPQFRENGELNMPSKMYRSAEDNLFEGRVIESFRKTTKNTTGVLLAGEKGTGKTVMAKSIAANSGLPIIVVDPKYPEMKLVEFFKEFETNVCVIFDEVDKNFNSGRMLDFLDGIHKTSKKMVLMTCNNINKVSEFLIDRASRVRYIRYYEMEDNLQYLNDILSDIDASENERALVSSYIRKHVTSPSIDNLCAIAEEIRFMKKEGKEITEKFMEDVLKFLNIKEGEHSHREEGRGESEDISMSFEDDDEEECTCCCG